MCQKQSFGCMCGSCIGSRRSRYSNEAMNTVYVVQIEDRFYHKTNRRGHMQRSISLAGAQTFGNPKDALAIRRLAEMKGHSACVHKMQVERVEVA